MENKVCSFIAIVGGHYGYRSLLESVEMVPWLSCIRDISRDRSTCVEIEDFIG